MKFFKKIKLLAITSAMVLSMSIPSYGRIILQYNNESHTYTAEPINLIVNDSLLVDLPLEPVIINDRTLVPAREVFEELGAIVDYKPLSREVFIGYKNNLIVLTIDSPQFLVNDLILELDVAPMIINDKTMLPFRAVAEAIGLTVEWDDSTRTVSVLENHPTMVDVVEVPIVEEPIETTPPENPEITVPDNKTNEPTDTSDKNDVTSINPTNEDVVDSTAPISYGLAVDKSTNNIVNMDYPHVEISSVTLPGTKESNEDSIIIRSTGPMSKIDKFLLQDNRLVIDIYNSTNASEKEQLSSHPAFTSVRTGQNQVDPEPITRVVTELSPNTEFSVELSTDRTELRVAFTKNKISNISFEQDEAGEYIKIFGDTAPNVLTSIDSNHKVLTLELPSSFFENNINYDVNSLFISNILASKDDNKINLTIKERPGVSIKKSELFTTITLKDLSKQNMVYDLGTKSILIKKGTSGLVASNLTLDEDFIVDHKLTLNFGGDYKDYLGVDEIINDPILHSYKINNNSNYQTEVVFNIQSYGTFAITETSEHILLSFKNPKEIYSKIVVIDPGHGGHDPGVVRNNLYEKDINLTLGNKLRPVLEAAGYKVYMTRSTDRFVPLVTIGEYSSVMGDLMLSLHANSAGSNAAPSGIETLWYPDSNTNIGISSEKAADILQSALIKNLGAVDRKTKKSALVIFKNSTIPSILAEVGFVTNHEESAKLQSDSYQNAIVGALAEGVNNIFSVYTPKR